MCVIHEEYLHQMTEDDRDALPSWSASGYVFEAAKFSDRTVPEQEERVILKVTADEIGLVLESEQLQAPQHIMPTAIRLTEFCCLFCRRCRCWRAPTSEADAHRTRI